jgi:serine/threonine protein kinase
LSACPHCTAPISADLRFCGQCGTALSTTTQALAPARDPWLGRIVDRRYRVLARIGTGGMGVVYRVEHLHLGKTAAMKVLAPDTAAKPEMLRRFRLEAQSVSKLNHPNIVQTFDFGQCDDAFYLVMEYLKGEDLAALLRRDGPWTFPRAARLFIQVCSGLTEAHDAGIVHRDLKPENLMVVARRDGAEHVKVLDFGLAKLRERTEGAGISTGGQVLGTPYYMAPEQVRGEAIDARADIYSLGATLYRVLTGEPPFDAPSPMSVLSKHLTEDVVPPRRRLPGATLPAEADDIVMRAMAKLPEERYSTAAEIQADLERALAAPSGERPASTVVLRPSHAATVPAPAPAPPAVATERSSNGDESDRLRRADVDDYEWSLRRRRLLMGVFYPVVALLVLASGTLFYFRRGHERGDGAEHEPNNTPGYANLLAQGAVRGTIGAPINDREGDIDYFRVPAGRGPRAVHARLEGIPGLDLVLELFDAQGRRLAKSDAHGRGLGEWLQPTSIGPAEAYLAVREVWIEGTSPTANALDPYTLTVRWGPPQPNWELEPNDWPAVATPINAGARVRGYLGSAEDRDWYVISVDHKTKLAGKVDAPAGLDPVVFRDEDSKKLINKRGPSGDEQFTIDAEPGKPALIGIARKLDPKLDPKDQQLAGLEDPYELVLEQVEP